MSQVSIFVPDPRTKVTLRDVLAPVSRHRLLTLMVFLGVMLGTITFAMFWAARYYTSQMQFLVDANRSNPNVTALQEAAVINREITPDEISSEIALLQGSDMLRQVASTCDLDKPSSVTDFLLPSDPAQRKAAKLEKATMTLGKALDVEEEKTSDVIDVSYGRTGDPSSVVCVLNNLAKLYLEKHVNIQRPRGTSEFFAEQAAEYQKKLGQAEGRLMAFSHDAGAAAPDAIRPFVAQQLALSTGSGYQLQEQISGDYKRIAEIETQIKTTPARSVSQLATAPANTLLQQLQDERVVAMNKRAALSVKYDPSYPLVKEADEEIANIDSALAAAKKSEFTTSVTDRDLTFENLRQELSKAQTDLAAHLASAKANDHSNEQIRQRLTEVDVKTVQAAALVRDVKAAETNYLLYVDKREEQRVSDALDKKRILDVALAVAPPQPVLPKWSPYLVSLIGLVLAPIVAYGSAAVTEYFDPTFRDSIDVTETLELPVLASLPRLKA